MTDELIAYTMYLVSATHTDTEAASETARKYIRLGASPRAGQALVTTAKVRALMRGRMNVAYEDIDALAYPVLRHRVKLNFDAVAAQKTPDQVIGELLAEIKPRRASRALKKG